MSTWESKHCRPLTSFSLTAEIICHPHSLFLQGDAVLQSSAAVTTANGKIQSPETKWFCQVTKYQLARDPSVSCTFYLHREGQRCFSYCSPNFQPQIGLSSSRQQLNYRTFHTISMLGMYFFASRHDGRVLYCCPSSFCYGCWFQGKQTLDSRMMKRCVACSPPEINVFFPHHRQGRLVS